MGLIKSLNVTHSNYTGHVLNKAKLQITVLYNYADCDCCDGVFNYQPYKGWAYFPSPTSNISFFRGAVLTKTRYSPTNLGATQKQDHGC